MSPVACSDSDKEWFEEFQNEDETQAEAFSRMVAQVKAYNGTPVDPEELAEELAHTLIPQVEVASYRGVSEGLEKYGAGSESNTGP